MCGYGCVGVGVACTYRFVVTRGGGGEGENTVFSLLSLHSSYASKVSSTSYKYARYEGMGH